MKTDPRVIVTIDKQFYSYDDEIRIHILYNEKIPHTTLLKILSPSGVVVDAAFLDSYGNTTESFSFRCGGPYMLENGYYTIQVISHGIISEAMFEYYKKGNQNIPSTR